jgi:hypothetical protein
MKRNETHRQSDPRQSGDVRRQIPIESDVDIVEARTAALVLASEAGFSGADLVMIATAVSEVARNIIGYARPGEVAISIINNGHRRGLEDRTAWPELVAGGADGTGRKNAAVVKFALDVSAGDRWPAHGKNFRRKRAGPTLVQSRPSAGHAAPGIPGRSERVAGRPPWTLKTMW